MSVFDFGKFVILISKHLEISQGKAQHLNANYVKIRAYFMQVPILRLVLEHNLHMHILVYMDL